MKIALVTGANRGLGLETSIQLAKKGFFVYMGMRDLEKYAGIVQDLIHQKLKVEAIKLDVTKTKDIRDFSNLIHSKNQKLDIIVNNAGVFLESNPNNGGSFAEALKADPVIILKSIEVNTMGPLKVVQSLVEHLEVNARIINISSGMGALQDMSGGYPGYRISKTALNALTRMLHSELRESKISVNSVCPGWVKTDMGGSNASLTTFEGVQTTLWLATMNNPPSGGFYRDKKEIPW
jgi:NAD(P)-dependent dehydrogenase (short-subunit alcohol dehydrogenase family)